MIAKAIARYIRISPKKARLVIDVVRGKSADEALAILMNTNKKASELVSDVIESAVNNAQRKHPEKKFTQDDFFISKIVADEGPALVRFRAASMGRASMIKKRSSHILVELDVIPEKLEEKSQKSKKKASKTQNEPKKDKLAKTRK